MRKSPIRTATTSAQFGNGVPAIDVLRLNHSMTFPPGTAVRIAPSEGPHVSSVIGGPAGCLGCAIRG